MAFLRRLDRAGTAVDRETPRIMQGRRVVPVILVQFIDDAAAPFPRDDYQHALFDAAPPAQTLTQYYRDMSDGRLQVSGTVSGWFPTTQPSSFYANGDSGKSGEHIGDLLDEAFAGAEKAGVDFGQFDDDGPDGVPNSGDDDGIVDVAIVVHSKVGAECGGGPDTIWSHEYNYRFLPQRHAPYETGAVARNVDGTPKLVDGKPVHIVIDDYTIQPAVDCETDAIGHPQLVKVGVFCHEFGHALGLPDLYDRTPSSCPDSEGIGNWCLMSGGAYGTDGRHSDTPSSLCAWAKHRLGWVDPVRISKAGVVRLEPVELQNRVYRLDVPETGGAEFFLVELRDPSWRDQRPNPKVNWDRFGPTSGTVPTAAGLAVWHVDERVGSDQPTFPFAPLNKGQNDAPSVPNDRRDRFAEPHALVALSQRDGMMQLEHFNVEQEGNRGDDGDLFITGSEFKDDLTFKAGSRGYSNKATGIAITAIDIAARTAMFQPATPSQQPASGPTTQPGKRPRDAIVLGIAPEKLARLTEIAGQIGAGSDARSLGAEERKTLARTPRYVLSAISPLGARHAVLAAARRERSFAPDAKPDSPQAEAIVNAARAFAPKAAVTVAPSMDRIEEMSNIGLPAQGDFASDASRLIRELAPLIGEGVTLAKAPLMEPGRAASRSQRFRQTVNVGGKALPIWGTEVSFHYDAAGALSVFRSHVVPPAALPKDLTRVNEVSADRARQVAAGQLGLPASSLTRIGAVEEGVFIPGGDPALARLGFDLAIPLGDHQTPLHAFFDAVSQDVKDVY